MSKKKDRKEALEETEPKEPKEAREPKTSKPPKAHRAFVERFPDLAKAWELMAEVGVQGPLDARAVRLVKLGVAIGAMREGAVHASVRKARDMGLSAEELEQVVAIAAGTIGLPSTVAVYSWVRDVLEKD